MGDSQTIFLAKLRIFSIMKNSRIPSLNALRAFEAAARHLSFGTAAAELFVTPAAISHQIRGLEEQLEQRLFHRVQRKVELTEAGRLLLPELREAFDLIERSVARLNEHREGGSLMVSASPALTAKWLLPRLHEFHQRHPEIEVHLDTNPLPADLRKSEVDLAIVFGSGDYAGLEVKPLKAGLREIMVPVCSPALLRRRGKSGSLRDLPLLHYDDPALEGILPDWQAWFEAAGIHNVDATRGARFNNQLLMIEAAIRAQGVALGCRFVVADDLESGRLVRPIERPCRLKHNYYIVHRRQHKQEAVARFSDWLTEAADQTGLP